MLGVEMSKTVLTLKHHTWQRLRRQKVQVVPEPFGQAPAVLFLHVHYG